MEPFSIKKTKTCLKEKLDLQLIDHRLKNRKPVVSGHLKTIILRDLTINKHRLWVQEVKKEQRELQKSNKQKLHAEEEKVN